MEKIGLEAVLEMGGFNRNVSKYQGLMSKMSDGMKNFGISSETASHALDTLLPIVGGVGLAVGGATAAFYALNKAMEFGKAGATIDQTYQSFDRLMTSLGVAPDILQQMSDATLNTVDNMTLMDGTMTMVAGASEKLSKAMIDAAPELLRISKAAVKLKPSLGDVAHVYESLALGIKRNSPMLIDNANIMVKVGEANERYAAKIGKTVEAMTAEDKQMALLEETMRAGQVMIQQVDGDVSAMGDSFAATEVALKNLTDELKMDAYPILVDFFKLLADGVGYVREAYETFKQLWVIMKAANAAQTALYTFQDPIEAFNEEFKKQVGIVEEAEEVFEDTTKEVENFNQAEGEATDTTDDLTTAQKALDDALKEIRKSYEDTFSTIASGIVEYRELGEAQAESAEDYQQKLKELNKEAGKSLQEVKDNFEASLPDRTTIQERMGMAEDAWDEWGLRIQDIIQNGVASPWYAVLQEMGYSKPPDVGMKEWAQDLQEQFYAGQLPDLLPPEWAENVRQQQQEATRIVQAENAKRLAEVEAARQAELAAEQEARNQALLEMALDIAESTNLLQAWSQQRFGPNFSQVADSADEVLALLQSGMIDIDSDLQAIIEHMTAGIQASLDKTGSAAEQNKSILEEIVTSDWASNQQALLEQGLNLDYIKEPFIATATEMGYSIEEALPETPFDYLLEEFDGASLSIMNQATLMALNLEGDFDTIDTQWAASVQNIVDEWDTGTTTIRRALRNKVIKVIEEEIPKEIIITVTTEVEGGEPEGRQSGGPVQSGVPYVVGEKGPEMFIPDQPGTIMPSSWTMALPSLLASTAGGAGGVAGPTISITMNPVINNGMDVAEFQALTERTVQQAIRGT